MTKQKFYELCVEKTLEYADPGGLYSELLTTLNYSEGMKFPEIKLKLSVCGIDTIPLKQDFEKWGIDFLIQLLGFASKIDDYDFTRKLFSFLEKHRKLWDVPGKKSEFGNAAYSVYVENLASSSRDFASELAGFILKNFGEEKWYNKFMSLCWGFGIFNYESTDLFFETRNKMFKKMAEGKNGKEKIW